MRRFLNPNQVSSVPKSWRTRYNDKDYRIPWHPTQTFPQFYSQVESFTRANGIPVPSSAEVEDMMCGQLPKGHCTGDSAFRPPPIRQTRGCAACGRR